MFGPLTKDFDLDITVVENVEKPVWGVDELLLLLIYYWVRDRMPVNVFENVSAGEASRQVIVSTTGI